MQAGWRIWPAAQLLNQSVVPIQFRTVSMDVVGFFWDMFLTFKVTGGGKAESITEGEEGVEADEGAGGAASSPSRRGGGGGGGGGSDTAGGDL